ncbi:hypothetical protein F5J12DRAFT_784790 [Pisolithus orientalis]|uniref:uncharacterized protein n=1 Tax=Pisolithus orientalis TaxID=936130 RepID=UPI00222499AA|nr:uncharacterized protein F5J12DRAFT_784790 [Pisolithus orientalis]KAI5998947.1 hypothetical protein F5J12DRAFT_784790 [Pisolithus orientalis]
MGLENGTPTSKTSAPPSSIGERTGMALSQRADGRGSESRRGHRIRVRRFRSGTAERPFRNWRVHRRDEHQPTTLASPSKLTAALRGPQVPPYLVIIFLAPVPLFLTARHESCRSARKFQNSRQVKTPVYSSHFDSGDESEDDDEWDYAMQLHGEGKWGTIDRCLPPRAERVVVVSEKDRIALVILAILAADAQSPVDEDYPFCHSCLDMHSKELRPKAIHDNELVDELANDYMHLACVKFINFRLSVLTTVSAIKAWEKVSAGMMEVYAAEVLGKLPVIQHFLFGSILHEGPSAPSGTGEDSAHHGHIHEGRGACAGYLSRVLLLRRRQHDRGPGIQLVSLGTIADSSVATHKVEC